MIRSELKKNAKNQLKNNWLLAIGVLIICQLISYIPNILSMVSENLVFVGIIIPIVILAITGILSIGQCKFFINLANKSNAKFSDLWYGFNNTLKAIGVTLLVKLLVGIIVFIGIMLLTVTGIVVAFMHPQVYYIAEILEIPIIVIETTLLSSKLIGIIAFIGGILLIIIGIIISFIYSQVYYIMAENPDMPVLDVLKESSRIMKGRKFELFVLQLSFIGWMILTGITAGIAGLYVFPYYNATLANFYLGIKN